MKKIIPVKNKSKAVRIAIEEFLRKDRLKKIDLLRAEVFLDNSKKLCRMEVCTPD